MTWLRFSLSVRSKGGAHPSKVQNLPPRHYWHSNRQQYLPRLQVCQRSPGRYKADGGCPKRHKDCITVTSDITSNSGKSYDHVHSQHISLIWYCVVFSPVSNFSEEWHRRLLWRKLFGVGLEQSISNNLNNLLIYIVICIFYALCSTHCDLDRINGAHMDSLGSLISSHQA